MKKSKHRCKHDSSRSATSVGIYIISAILVDAEYAVDWPWEEMACCRYDFYKLDHGQAKRANLKQQNVLISSAYCAHEENVGCGEIYCGNLRQGLPSNKDTKPTAGFSE